MQCLLPAQGPQAPAVPALPARVDLQMTQQPQKRHQWSGLRMWAAALGGF